MSSTTKETLEMLENLLNSQIAMGQVMDSIITILDTPPAPMEELVEEVLMPMAEAVKQAGTRLGLQFQAPEQAEQTDGPEWDQMDPEQRKAEINNIKKMRAIAKHQREKDALTNSMPQPQPLESEMGLAPSLLPPSPETSALDLMADMMATVVKNEAKPG